MKFKLTEIHPNPEGNYFLIKIVPEADFTDILYKAHNNNFDIIWLFTPEKEPIGFLSSQKPEVTPPGFSYFRVPKSMPLFPPYEELKDYIKEHVLPFEF